MYYLERDKIIIELYDNIRVLVVIILKNEKFLLIMFFSKYTITLLKVYPVINIAGVKLKLSS